jgi:hypothetical protein
MEEVFKATFDDSEITKKLDDLEKQVLAIGKSVDTVGNQATESLNQAADAAGNFTAEMDTAATQTAKQAKAVEQARAANQGWLQSIRQTIAGQQVAGKSLGEWVEQAQTFAQAINTGTAATGRASAAMRVFTTVLKASGIGLLIGLVASVIGYFTRFQAGIDKVSQVMAGLNAVINVVVERFVKLGSAIVKVFTGDFAGAAADVTSAVTGIGDALADAAVQAFNLEKRLQALRDVTITQSVEAARARVELDKFRQIVDDGTQSFGARIQAAKQAGDIEKQLAAQAVDRALEAQQIAQQKFALDKESLAAREEAAKAEVEFQEAVSNLNKANFDAEKEVRELRKEASDERRKQQEEELKKAEALRKEYEKLFADVQKQADALNIENTFNPIQKVEKEFAAALNGVEDLQKKLIALATTDKQRKDVEAAIAKLFNEVVKKYNEELAKARIEIEKIREGTEPIPILPPADAADEDLKFRAKSAIKKLQAAAKEAIDEQEPRSLAEILGISDEGLEGLKDAAGQIIDSLEQIADARVKEADAAVDAAERKVSAAQDALEREQELAAEGLANDTDLAKKQLDEAKKAEEEAQKERAKAVRTQILLDSALQLSSLVTSSANIFKSLSPLGPFGIAGAIATIGIMFGAFAKAKSDALKAASAPKFRKGGKLEGPAHEYGGIPISDSEGNVYGEAEGGEWIVNKRESQAHDRFLKRLNDGEFAGVDLDRVFKPSASNPLTDAAPRIARIEQERREMETTMNMEAMATAYEKTAAQIVQAIKEQPEIYPLTNYKVKRRKGRNTYTEIVRQEG